jgi:hypothetical protein
LCFGWAIVQSELNGWWAQGKQNAGWVPRRGWIAQNDVEIVWAGSSMAKMS